MHLGIGMTEKQHERKKQSGYERLGRTERQNQGYDEAAHGGKNVPSDDVGIPLAAVTSSIARRATPPTTCDGRTSQRSSDVLPARSAAVRVAERVACGDRRAPGPVHSSVKDGARFGYEVRETDLRLLIGVDRGHHFHERRIAAGGGHRDPNVQQRPGRVILDRQRVG
jgi:hypothetical protein